MIDPICEEDDGKSIGNINVIGKMVEDVDLTSLNPDLILCRHTLEHIENPLTFFEQLVDQCDEKCTFIFEVPCFDSLMESMRFDAVFHQHLHYFTLENLKWLLSKVGAEMLGHRHNFQGSCGGALLFAFKKANKISKTIEKPNAEKKIKLLKSKIKLYEEQMLVFQEQIKYLNELVSNWCVEKIIPEISDRIFRTFGLEPQNSSEKMTWQVFKDFKYLTSSSEPWSTSGGPFTC